MSAIGLHPQCLDTGLWMTDYGERVRLRFQVPSKTFETLEGLKMVLTVECFNSVDKTCGLEIRIKWGSSSSKKGLILLEKSTLRKVHDSVWMNRDDGGSFLAYQLKNAENKLEVIRDWANLRIGAKQIAR